MLRSRGMIGSVFSLADKAAQIAVEIPRQLSSRLFLGACLPFPRLHTPKRAFLVSIFAVYAGIPRILSRCIMRGSPRLILIIHTLDSALIVLQRTGCMSKCLGIENMSSWNGVPCPFLICSSSDVTNTYVPLPDFQLRVTHSI